MKKLRPRVFVACMLSLDIFFLVLCVFQVALWKEFDIKFTCCVLCMQFLLGYIPLRARVDYQEDYLIRFYLFGKEKIDYKDIARIYTRPSPGMYVIESYDGKSYGLYLPMEHKRLSELFENITKANPDVIIDVSWYTKEPKKLFNDFIKIALFFIAVFIIDFVRRYIIKKFF